MVFRRLQSRGGTQVMLLEPNLDVYARMLREIEASKLGMELSSWLWVFWWVLMWMILLFSLSCFCLFLFPILFSPGVIWVVLFLVFSWFRFFWAGMFVGDSFSGDEICFLLLYVSFRNATWLWNMDTPLIGFFSFSFRPGFVPGSCLTQTPSRWNM